MSRWGFNNFVFLDQDKKLPTSEAFRNNWFILKLVWRIHPQRVIAAFILELVNQIPRLFSTLILIRFLIESFENGTDFSNIIYLVAISLALYFTCKLYAIWYDTKFQPISDTILYEHLYGQLFQKASEVELDCYENPKFYDTYTTAIQEADIRVNEVLRNIACILSAAIASIAIFTVMFSIDKIVVLFALFPILGNFIFGKIVNQMIYKRYMDFIPFRRKIDYVDRVVYLSQYAKEIRLSNVFNVLKKIYAEGYTGVLRVAKSHQIGLIKYDFIRNAFSFTFIFEGVLLYGAYRAIVSESISISEFGVLATAMVAGAWVIIDLAERFIKIYENAIFIRNLQYFMEYEPSMKDKPNAQVLERGFSEIHFKDVGFSYNGTTKNSIWDLNVVIKSKKKIALVGQNGAGKTTFTKLLMRLYDATEGAILIDGHPIDDYTIASFRSHFAVAFQDYQMFSMTVAENVLMKEIETEEEEAIVKNALQKSGVYDKIYSLPKGIHTILTREFDDEGVSLSGGELQKIAIARVFAQDADIVVLDEPTSALDPIAEYMLYQNIVEQCAEQTVIFISHRLSSAAIADEIYLFDEGQLVEKGTHQELMAQKGLYCEMFMKQAEKYIESDELTAAYQTDTNFEEVGR